MKNLIYLFILLILSSCGVPLTEKVSSSPTENVEKLKKLNQFNDTLFVIKGDEKTFYFDQNKEYVGFTKLNEIKKEEVNLTDFGILITIIIFIVAVLLIFTLIYYLS